ncbi:Crp/Fnr family transcriptional regulator [Listeria booriae]|uniref:Crp/Fnr family transcriptional regulator n=1 Tax=Listeria booriae TaxID=1552123 RepID=UPI00164D7843|nr:Crp/Fnr family transcriptional regulator [Listeria booriae]MBC6162433.1 Crp/Fnr family transcriptional regulator [Listeria booriae]MBC6165528.1 Crp/Fnr family transcriptional regulator [Listeria booriae]
MLYKSDQEKLDIYRMSQLLDNFPNYCFFEEVKSKKRVTLDVDTYLYYIHSGYFVNYLGVQEEEKRTFVAILHAGDDVGMGNFFKIERADYINELQAITNSSLIKIDKEFFISVLEQHEELISNVFVKIQQELEYLRRAQILSIIPIEKYVKYMLHLFSKAMGMPSGGEIVLPKEITRRYLSNLSNISMTPINETFSKLGRDGIIREDDGIISILDHVLLDEQVSVFSSVVGGNRDA